MTLRASLPPGTSVVSVWRETPATRAAHARANRDEAVLWRRLGRASNHTLMRWWPTDVMAVTLAEEAEAIAERNERPQS